MLVTEHMILLGANQISLMRILMTTRRQVS